MGTDVHTIFKLLMDSKVEMADYRKNGTFFEIVNESKKGIKLLEFEGGAANSSAREATLFICKEGRCRGHEANVGNWYTGWNGWL